MTTQPNFKTVYLSATYTADVDVDAIAERLHDLASDLCPCGGDETKTCGLVVATSRVVEHDADTDPMEVP